MGAGNSTPKSLVPANPFASSTPTAVNPNPTIINQRLLEAQTAINNNDRVTAKTILIDAIALGANTTDPRVTQLKSQLGLSGGKRRKSKRSSKPKRKSRRKQRT